MTPLGWIFLIASLAFVYGLCGWCFRKVLTLEDVEHFEEPPASLGG